MRATHWLLLAGMIWLLISGMRRVRRNWQDGEYGWVAGVLSAGVLLVPLLIGWRVLPSSAAGVIVLAAGAGGLGMGGMAGAPRLGICHHRLGRDG